MSKKKKRNSDTREFTALKTSDCKNKQQNGKPEQQSEKMIFTDRAQKPSFEV